MAEAIESEAGKAGAIKAKAVEAATSAQPEAPAAVVVEQPAPAQPVAQAATEAPAVKPAAANPARAVRKPRTAKAPAVQDLPVEPAPVAAKPARKKPARRAPAQSVAAQPAKARRASAAMAASKPQVRKPAPVAKPTKSSPPKFKETIMATKKTPDFAEGIKTAMTEAQAKAKEAYEKATGLFGETGEFAKGNVEALVESGKIFSAGLQELGSAYAAEAKNAFDAMTADVKELATAKTPTDFFKLQGEMLRRSFDAAVATGSKHSEAMLKLTNDAFAPISSRVSVAMEKVKKAA